MRTCLFVLAYLASTCLGRRVHIPSGQSKDISSALDSLANLLVASSDPVAAWQFGGYGHNFARKSVATHHPESHVTAQSHRRSADVLSQATKEKGGIMLLSNPKYLRPVVKVAKVGREEAFAGGGGGGGAGLRGPPLRGAPLRGPPPGGLGLRGPPQGGGLGLRGPPQAGGLGLRGPPLRGPPRGPPGTIQGPPLRGPPLRGRPPRGPSSGGPPLRGPPLRGGRDPFDRGRPSQKPDNWKDEARQGWQQQERDYGGEFEDMDGGPGSVYDNGKPKKKKKGKEDYDDVDDDERALMDLRKNKKKKKKALAEDSGPVEVLLSDSISVADLAKALRVGPGEVIKSLMKMGTLASMTQEISSEQAEKITTQFGGVVLRVDTDKALEADALGTIEVEEDEESLVPRPPVVTIMGHVDHGKTSLLDAMRKANVAEGEAGGITQHIGAYSVKSPDGEKTVTFIDTPGHAAFNEMRSRGANTTDIVVLVVAGDDGVMPQTVHSIKAAKSANVPMIVAFTKADKPGVDQDKIKQQLLQHEVVLEDFGGEVISASVSAKTGAGLDELFESINLQAEVLDLKANPNRMASGTVLEARQERGSGSIATVLIQRGTVNVGDIVVAGAQWGRVRSLQDEKGQTWESAGPSMAVEILGLNGVPEAGDVLTGTEDELSAKELAETRQKMKQAAIASSKFARTSASEQNLFFNGTELPTKVLDFIVKADVQGSAEAVAESLRVLGDSDDKLAVKVEVLRATAGELSQVDIDMAAVEGGSILCFNLPMKGKVVEDAKASGVEILEFDVIYDAIDAVNAKIASLLRPPPAKQLGELCGQLDVKQVFKVSAIGKVAGCNVLEGFIRVGNNIRILRGNLILYEGKLKTLRSFQEEVDRVDEGNECGMSFDDFQGMEAGDRVEAYRAPDQLDEEEDDY